MHGTLINVVYTHARTHARTHAYRFQPVFGSMIAMLIGLEHFQWIKVIAVLFAVGGAIMMMGDSLWKKKTLVRQCPPFSLSLCPLYESMGLLFCSLITTPKVLYNEIKGPRSPLSMTHDFWGV